jgi:hypothetical protein
MAGQGQKMAEARWWPRHWVEKYHTRKAASEVLLGGVISRLDRYRTNVLMYGTFGMSDQGQTLDV